MLNTKFRENRPAGSRKDYFLLFFFIFFPSYMGVAAILVM